VNAASPEHTASPESVSRQTQPESPELITPVSPLPSRGRQSISTPLGGWQGNIPATDNTVSGIRVAVSDSHDVGKEYHMTGVMQESHCRSRSEGDAVEEPDKAKLEGRVAEKVTTERGHFDSKNSHVCQFGSVELPTQQETSSLAQVQISRGSGTNQPIEADLYGEDDKVEAMRPEVDADECESIRDFQAVEVRQLALCGKSLTKGGIGAATVTRSGMQARSHGDKQSKGPSGNATFRHAPLVQSGNKTLDDDAKVLNRKIDEAAFSKIREAASFAGCGQWPDIKMYTPSPRNRRISSRESSAPRPPNNFSIFNFDIPAEATQPPERAGSHLPPINKENGAAAKLDTQLDFSISDKPTPRATVPSPCPPRDVQSDRHTPRASRQCSLVADDKQDGSGYEFASILSSNDLRNVEWNSETPFGYGQHNSNKRIGQYGRVRHRQRCGGGFVAVPTTSRNPYRKEELCLE